MAAPFTVQAAIERTLWESGGSTNDLFWGGHEDEFANAAGFSQVSIHPTVAIAKIINVGLGFMGVLATCLIILAGFKWMLSGGNEDKIKECKKTIVGTVVGSVIIFSSFSVVQYFLDALINATMA